MALRNIQTYCILLVVFLGLTTFSQADIGPPRGTKRIPVHYIFKAPKDSIDHVYLWFTTNSLNLYFALSPVKWNQVMRSSQGYRDSTLLISISKKQVSGFIKQLSLLPALQKQQAKLKSMKVDAQMNWLRSLKMRFEPSSTGQKKVISAFLKFTEQTKHATLLALAHRTLVAQMSPATSQLRVLQLKGTQNKTIDWKATDKSDRDKNNHVVPPLIGKGAFLFTRWKWIIAGFLAALLAAFMIRKRQVR